MKKIIATLAFSTISITSNAAILYQNDFDSLSSPTYTTVFGSPQVVGPVYGNSSNSLAFNSAGNAPSFYYDQIEYSIGSAGYNFQNYSVGFDITTENLTSSANQFAVLFDTPTVRNLIFGGDGTISVQNFGGGASGIIGNFTDTNSMRVDMDFNIADNRWDIFVDNALLYSDIMDANLLDSVRFSFGAKYADQVDYNATAFVDNITISAVPVPAAIWLFGSGLLCLLGFKRSQANT